MNTGQEPEDLIDDEAVEQQKIKQNDAAKEKLASREEPESAESLLKELMAEAKEVEDKGYTIYASHDLVGRVHAFLADA